MPNTSPLRSDAQRIVSTVAAKLISSHEVAERFEVTSHQEGFKHGLLGPNLPEPAPPEASGESAEDAPEATIEDEMQDLKEALTGDAYDRTELPSSDPGELVVRATPRRGAEIAGEIAGADFVFSRTPARLLRATVHAPSLPRFAGWIMKQTGAELAFTEIDGVPLVSEMRVRMRSRGFGRARFDYEFVTTAEYAPLAEG